MKKTERNLTLLTTLFCTALVISNVVTARIVPFINGWTVAGAVFMYPITFLITDIVGEVWGKKEANRIVLYGFLCQIFATLLIVFTGLLPCIDGDVDAAYKMLLGQNAMIVLGSLIAYYCSQSWDVYIFHKIREKYIAKHGDVAGGRWIWNNASTMTSQLIDTALFIVISFGVGFGWLFNAGMHGALINMLIGQYVLKVILAALDTPLFYFFTRKIRE